MNLLITGAWTGAADHITEIESNGHKVVFLKNEKDELPCTHEEIEGIICNGLFLYHDIRRFSRLRYIQLTSAGFDRISLDYVLEHNIKIHNARGVYSVPMAEYAVAAALYFFKQLRFFDTNKRKRIWEKSRTLAELIDKTVCIVGCGSVGSECAKRFRAFGSTVIGVDTNEMRKEEFKKILSTDELDRALGDADVIVLTLPLTDRTRHIIDERRIKAMKDGAILINIARGAVVDPDALYRRLSQKTLYAALDVFEEEPLPEDSPVWDMDNVLVTPHNSFVGDKNADRLHDVIIKNLKEEQHA